MLLILKEMQYNNWSMLMKMQSYISKYSQTNMVPKYWHILYVSPSLVRRGLRIWPEFKRFLKANNLPAGSSISTESGLPEIELLVVAIEKDYWLLPHCILAGISSSRNAISKVTVITPGKTADTCLETLTNFSFDVPIFVLAEENVISEKSISKISEKFGNSYGWVLQQFLTLAYVLMSDARGVLSINADTLLISEQIWLDQKRNQKILVSHEYHPPYYQLLEILGITCNPPKFTFITHHMLFQPLILKEILNKIGVENVDDLISKSLVHVDTTQQSSICIEFELYAQGMFIWMNNCIELSRFGNLPLSAKSNELGNILNRISLGEFKNYNSVSLHSWS